jgi:hypothetical protein
MLERQPYTSDLTDAEWTKLEPLLPPDKAVGRLREVDLREVFNAIYYRADNGVKWRNTKSTIYCNTSGPQTPNNGGFEWLILPHYWGAGGGSAGISASVSLIN